MVKEELRRYALLKRKSLSYDKDFLITNVLNVIKGKNIAIYYPMKYEIDLLFLKDYGFNLLFPKVVGNDLVFYENVTKFSLSSFKVNEPLDGNIFSKDKIDFMFVPSLVINKNNYRIGYGKGYYDRYLSNRSFKAYGICYEELYLDYKENDYDERLDGVIICKQ